MKQLLSIALLMVFSIAQVGAKDRASAHTTVKGELVSVTYGQPSKKGRNIFGELVPFGKVWRTGADEATEITFEQNCMFGGKKVEKGTYTLFTIPGQQEWTIILNAKLGQWGAFDYETVKDKDVLTIKVQSKTLNSVTEKFTITLPKNGVQMDWDKTSVLIEVKATM